MPRNIHWTGVLAALALGCAATPALADFSACGSAYAAQDLQQKIDLYTICLKHGGLVSTDVAGALINRGVAYERLGETDKALQDFSAAIQYDRLWPDAYVDRAIIEAQRGQCPQALADIGFALKLAPHRKPFLDMKARMAATCAPASSAPPG